MGETRAVSSQEGLDYLMAKLYRMPEQFREKYYAKEYSSAKYLYDTAVRVALFMELPAEDKIRLFGNGGYDDRLSNPVDGLFPEHMVDKVYLECVVKRNEGLENATRPPTPFLAYEKRR